MAFRQPTYHTPQRIYTVPDESRLDVQHQHDRLGESQEWVLFSPATASITDRAFTASTSRTRPTTGRSRVSDYGSLGTAAQSYGFNEDGSEHSEGPGEDEDDGELDSLDSHLHEFRADSSAHRESLQGPNSSVLPKHDGLGSFRINQTTMGEGVQEHLYAFEQYNPRRIKRRRESLELGQIELERVLENERIMRIEAWRVDQSRALLDEIRKETRRRKQSMSSERRSVLTSATEEELATMGSVEGLDMDQNTTVPEGESDSFWKRITRRVIEDLMGIDDRFLSILFGEALPEDDDPSSTPSAARPTYEAVAASWNDDSWENRLLERIARELGLLVHQLSDHPGAFSTYLQMQQMPLPYAGLPIIPEVVQDASVDTNLSVSASTPDFQPTIQTQTQPLDISRGVSRSTCVNDIDATPRLACPIHQAIDTESSIEISKEEWEKEIDIKMVFRYLKSRFTSRHPSPPPFSRNLNLATSSLQDAAARADRVRQNHPLVSKQKPADRRTFKAVTPNSPILYRRGSSCASLSTRKSVRRNSSSSRHYWDVNGSIGSGSLIASAGAWGEV
jgi:hypothetical protein